jgi:hypothetical protein
MLSEEFLIRQENWPVIVEAARKVIELNQMNQAPASTPQAATATPDAQAPSPAQAPGQS